MVVAVVDGSGTCTNVLVLIVVVRCVIWWFAATVSFSLLYRDLQSHISFSFSKRLLGLQSWVLAIFISDAITTLL